MGKKHMFDVIRSHPSETNHLNLGCFKFQGFKMLFGEVSLDIDT